MSAKTKDDANNPVLNKYMKSLRWRLFWMSGSKKKLLMEETRAHLIDIADDVGGRDRDAAFTKAIDRFGAPGKVAGEYKYNYGYGKKFLAVMIIIAVLLSALTVPFFSNLPPVGETAQDKENLQNIGNCCGVLSVIFLILTFVVIIFAGLKAGRWQGLIVGSCAAGARMVVLVVTILGFGIIGKLVSNALTDAAGMSIDLNLVPEPWQAFCVFFVALLMPVAGFLAGRGIKQLNKSELFRGYRGAAEDEEDEELELF